MLDLQLQKPTYPSISSAQSEHSFIAGLPTQERVDAGTERWAALTITAGKSSANFHLAPKLSSAIVAMGMFPIDSLERRDEGGGGANDHRPHRPFATPSS